MNDEEVLKIVKVKDTELVSTFIFMSKIEEKITLIFKNKFCIRRMQN